MEKNLAIKINNLCKVYNLAGHDIGISISERIRNIFNIGKKNKAQKPEKFYALNNINLEIEKGACVGIIGRNGTGKSTLLKILSKVVEPSSGTVEIYGKVASVLEVGMGFHPDLTGRENVYLSGALYGLSKKQIHKYFDDIVAFSEIGKFIDQPVKHYSSGMYVRLAFSVAANIDADILLFDEVLSVGDLSFQMKCAKKIKELVDKKKTIILVSHNMNDIIDLCQTVVCLEEGCIQEKGSTGIIKKYFEDAYNNDLKCLLKRSKEESTEQEGFKNVLIKKWGGDNILLGDEKLRINKMYLINESDQKCVDFYTNHNFSISIEYDKLDDDDFLDISFFISNMNFKFLGCHTLASDINIKEYRKKGNYTAKVIFEKDFFSDTIISIGFAVFRNNKEIVCFENDVLQLKLKPHISKEKEDYYKNLNFFVGPLVPKMKWEIVEMF